MPFSLRPCEAHDFATLHRLDQACFPRGIAYSKSALRYFLNLPSAECLVAEGEAEIAGFILAQRHERLAHIITLDVSEPARRQGVGSALLQRMETNLAAQGVRLILLETATTNEAAIAFWEKHGYRTEAVVKNYYPGKLDAFEMRKMLSPQALQNRPSRKPEER